MIKPHILFFLLFIFIISLKVIKDFFYKYIIMSNPITAIAVFNGHTIKGTVKFTEQLDSNLVQIDVNLSGLNKNALHGFHVHESGDLTDKCESMCAHFNPYGKQHGCPGKKERHVGDLGNIETNNKRSVEYFIFCRKKSNETNVSPLCAK